MKAKLKYIFMLATILLWSCEKDGVKLRTTTDLEAASSIVLSNSNIVLTEATAQDSVLLVTWSTTQLTLNNDEYKIDNQAISNTLQIDTDATFSAPREYTRYDSIYFTGSELNLFAKTKELAPNVAEKVYLRIVSSIGGNNSSKYSAVKEFYITPFDAGADYLYIGLGSDRGSITDFSNKLVSKEKNNKYSGFFYAPNTWQNFRFTPQENTDGTVYGSNPSDRFTLDSSEEQWGLWLDGSNGLHFLTADLTALTWSFLPMSAINIYGDFNGWNATSHPLTWDATTKSYSTTVTFSAAASQFKFVPTGEAGSLWSYQLGKGDLDNEIVLDGGNVLNPSAGTFKVVLNLSDPNKYTIEYISQD